MRSRAVLEAPLQRLPNQFSALGIQVEIREQQTTIQTAIVSAFLKPSNTMVQLAFSGAAPLKIKLEVDTDPPLGFETEEQLQRRRGEIERVAWVGLWRQHPLSAHQRQQLRPGAALGNTAPTRQLVCWTPEHDHLRWNRQFIGLRAVIAKANAGQSLIAALQRCGRGQQSLDTLLLELIDQAKPGFRGLW